MSAGTLVIDCRGRGPGDNWSGAQSASTSDQLATSSMTICLRM